MRKPTNSEIIAAWDAAADHLSDWSDEGDFARKHLLNPTAFELLGDTQGLRVLDGGCGEGYLARLLARRGAIITGVEPATRLFHLRVQREREEPLGIIYLQQDICDLSPADGAFDRIVLNMTLMDIPDVERAIATCASALSPGGRLIASILHPCFDAEPMSRWPTRRRIEVQEHLDEALHPQTFAPFFHRPLSLYVNLLIEAGLTIKRVIEPRLQNPPPDSINDRDAHVPTFIALRADRLPA
jgi:2-polyprenyl-3-methyl-5-hydroxy-6-metoxy-1,4-benzoquinol methylase